MFWLSLEWFSPQAWLTWEWQHLEYLLGLPVLPFLFALRWLGHWQVRQKLAVAFTATQLQWRSVSLLRYLPSALLSLVMVFLLVALARPQRIQNFTERTAEGIDIMLAIDVSESMLIEDFQPNRLSVAKNTAKAFIAGRQFDRIGLVLFSGIAYTLSPLTTDYELLRQFIDQEVQFGAIPEEGTAIGNALGTATYRLRDSPSKSKVIILLSDGDNVGGSVDPLTAAGLAAYYNLKVYTIALGQEGEVPFTDRQTGVKKYFKNTMNETSLREIARLGEGQFFRANDQAALQEIFRKINEYEKTPVTEVSLRQVEELYPAYLCWALIFWLLWLLAKSSVWSNILED